MSETAYLLQTFKFRVSLTRVDPGPTNATLGTGAFSECSGLQLEADVKEYLEGGRNDGVIRRVGRVKLVPLVLKRGMFSAAIGQVADSSIWDWLTAMVTGAEVRRYHGQVELMDPSPLDDGAGHLDLRPRPADEGGRADAECQDRRYRGRGAAHRS